MRRGGSQWQRRSGVPAAASLRCELLLTFQMRLEGFSTLPPPFPLRPDPPRGAETHPHSQAQHRKTRFGATEGHLSLCLSPATTPGTSLLPRAGSATVVHAAPASWRGVQSPPLVPEAIYPQLAQPQLPPPTQGGQTSSASSKPLLLGVYSKSEHVGFAFTSAEGGRKRCRRVPGEASGAARAQALLDTNSEAATRLEPGCEVPPLHPV